MIICFAFIPVLLVRNHFNVNINLNKETYSLCNITFFFERCGRAEVDQYQLFGMPHSCELMAPCIAEICEVLLFMY